VARPHVTASVVSHKRLDLFLCGNARKPAIAPMKSCENNSSQLGDTTLAITMIPSSSRYHLLRRQLARRAQRPNRALTAWANVRQWSRCSRQRRSTRAVSR
jgi:hypothetical protein